MVALPADEYFDDECITDTNSSLGAFAQHHFADRVDEFVQHVQAELDGLPSQRVPRAERRIDESYGIWTSDFSLQAAVGVPADPGVGDHRANRNRAARRTALPLRRPGGNHRGDERTSLNSVTMPVLGSGHGGMPLSIAILFNLLAVRSITAEALGAHLRKVRIVVFEGDADDLADTTMQDIISHVTPAWSGGNR